jgi:hypothetical protein
MFESEQWRTGRAGEEDLAAWFRRNAFHTISLDKIEEDGAPSLIGDNGDRIILTDLIVAQQGITRGVEVKTKSCPTLHMKSKTWEHGIETRLFEHYRAQVKKLGIEIWLAIFQLDKRLVLMEDVVHLHRVRRDYGGPNMPNGRPHVFFACDEFQQYYGPSTPRARPIPPKAKRTLAQGPQPDGIGPKQMDLFK